MKRLSLMLAMVILVGLFIAPCALADNGREFSFSYDMETFANGRFPDENWTVTTGGNQANILNETVDGDKAFKILHYGEPVLKFGQLVTEGNMRISFDVMLTGANPGDAYRNIMVVFYDGRGQNSSNPDAITYDDDLSSGLRINAYTNRFEWFDKGTAGIHDDTSDQFLSESSDPDTFSAIVGEGNSINNQWLHCDLVTTGMTGADAVINYYVNGVKVNSNPIKIERAKGFKAVGFRVGGFSGNADDTQDQKDAYIANGCAYVDNVKVTRYFGQEGIVGTASGKVALTDGASVNISLSEDVDPELLTTDNITIKNTVTESSIDGFTISNQSVSGFTVTFPTALESGAYELMLSPSVTGGNLGYIMRNPVEIRTEYKTTFKSMEYADIDFNDYAATAIDNALPTDWSNIENVANTYAYAADGNALPNEITSKSLGFKTSDIVSNPTRFIHLFKNDSGENISIPALSEYTVSFDIYRNSMNWYLYLLEEGDGVAGVTDDLVIGSTANNGNLKYSSTGETLNSSLSTTPVGNDAWYSVELKVTPISNGVKYTVKINEGTPVEVTSVRRFDINKTIGIGIGYRKNNTNEGELRIDNVRVYSDMNILHPEVEQARFYSYDGSETEAGDGMSTLIDKINLGFNTLVDETSAKNAISITGGTNMDYDVEVKTIGGKSVAEVTLNNMFEADTNYRISVAPGVKSAYNGEVLSEVTFAKKISTRSDETFKYNASYDPVNKELTASFVKNNDQEGKYTIAIAGYNLVTKTIDGQSVTVRQLVGIEYLPIEISADTKGIITKQLSANFNGSICTEYDYFLWTYPKQLKVNLDETGTINQ